MIETMQLGHEHEVLLAVVHVNLQEFAFLRRSPLPCGAGCAASHCEV